jgi:hypothetical protein
MAATIKIKNSSTASAVPTSSDLVQGELAVNVTDKRIFTENASGTVVELGTNPSILTLPDGSASAPTLTNDGDTNTGIFFPAADTVGITTGGTERLRVDASGNLLVGGTTATNSASGRGNIVINGSSNAMLNLTVGNTQKGYLYHNNTDILLNNAANGAMLFYTNDTERARIDSSGNLLVGTTATDSGAKTRIVYGASSNGLQLKDSADTSNTAFVIFQNGSNSNIGTISRVGTTNVVAYNTTSDERLKNDLGVAVSDTVIDALVIHNFSWKTDGTLDRGVFAQEAAIVKPLAVREGSDELDENGNPKNPWGVDYSKFVPDLIVYCQQLKKQVQQLQADVAALKGQA